MIKARIITLWVEPIEKIDIKTQSPLLLSRHPKVLEDHPPHSYTDVTGTPSEKMPTPLPFLIAECEWEDDSFKKLMSDDNYSKSILWSDILSSKDRIALKGILDISDHFVEIHGVDQEKVDNLLTDISLGDNREVVAEKLADYLKNQDKAE